MWILRRVGHGAPALVMALAGIALMLPPAPSVLAASSLQTLVATAEHNTNTVRTLIHNDRTTTIAPGGSIQVSARGTEDEVRNREQDYESVLVTQRAGGKVNTVNYTVDIIFLNGSTYYRTSLAPAQWKTQKGMAFADPYTGGWKRGRTRVQIPANLTFKDAGTSAGQKHVHASFSTPKTAGTVDLWITTGSKPFVVRQDLAVHATKGPAGSEHAQIRYGPFNTDLNIQPPGQASA